MYAGQRCDETLTAPANGSMQCSGEPVTDQTCSFSCDTGFELRLSQSRRCNNDHTWTGSEPYCEPRLCRPLKRPLNAYLTTVPCPTVLGSVCMVECVDGYHVSGDYSSPMYQQCRVNTTTNEMYWSDPPRCTCK